MLQSLLLFYEMLCVCIARLRYPLKREITSGISVLQECNQSSLGQREVYSRGSNSRTNSRNFFNLLINIKLINPSNLLQQVDNYIWRQNTGTPNCSSINFIPNLKCSFKFESNSRYSRPQISQDTNMREKTLLFSYLQRIIKFITQINFEGKFHSPLCSQ